MRTGRNEILFVNVCARVRSLGRFSLCGLFVKHQGRMVNEYFVCARRWRLERERVQSWMKVIRVVRASMRKRNRDKDSKRWWKLCVRALVPNRENERHRWWWGCLAFCCGKGKDHLLMKLFVRALLRERASWSYDELGACARRYSRREVKALMSMVRARGGTTYWWRCSCA